MLVISTATKKAYIALKHSGKCYFSEVDADSRQSENILKEIDKLLEKNNISLKDISTLGVVIGPGSFTGLRIGVSLIKGIVAGDSTKKVVEISTFDLMAREFEKKYGTRGDFYCVLNALSGKLFVEKFNKDCKPISKAEMVLKDDFDTILAEKVVLEEEFPTAFNTINLSSTTLLDEAIKKFEKKEFVSAQNLEPKYIRKSQAEENIT